MITLPYLDLIAGWVVAALVGAILTVFGMAMYAGRRQEMGDNEAPKKWRG